MVVAEIQHFNSFQFNLLLDELCKMSKVPIRKRHPFHIFITFFGHFLLTKPISVFIDVIMATLQIHNGRGLVDAIWLPPSSAHQVTIQDFPNCKTEYSCNGGQISNVYCHYSSFLLVSLHGKQIRNAKSVVFPRKRLPFRVQW